MHTTRESLLHRMRSREDSEAWSRFVELYTPLVIRWVGDLGITEPDRGDLVQEVFVVLLGQISSFQYEPSGSFRGWLRTVTINKCRDFQRLRRRKCEPQFLAAIEQAAADDSEWLTEEQYRQYLISAAMKLMRQHFSETTWQAVWLHVAEGRTAADVARELNMTENAVYLARGRVLRRLRSELDGLWE